MVGRGTKYMLGTNEGLLNLPANERQQNNLLQPFVKMIQRQGEKKGKKLWSRLISHDDQIHITKVYNFSEDWKVSCDLVQLQDK